MFSTLSKKTLIRAALLQDAPVYVQFYITARCNLTCQQCNIIYANSDVRECTLEEIKRMADINGDGSIDAVDLQLLINDILSGTFDSKADLNKDGSIDAVDLQMLVNIILG